jgi:hypothetical protein
VRVQHRVPASFATSPTPALIRNLSLGGVLIESNEPFHVGSVHQLCIGHDADAAPLIAARSVYSQAQTLPDGSVRFLTGFAFLRHQEDPAQQVVFDLVESSGPNVEV